MSSGERTSYEILAVKAGMAARALTQHCDPKHQVLRAACAVSMDRVSVHLFLSDMLYAACAEFGGVPFAESDDLDIDREEEQRNTCISQRPSDWGNWCWTCRAKQIVDEATR